MREITQMNCRIDSEVARFFLKVVEKMEVRSSASTVVEHILAGFMRECPEFIEGICREENEPLPAFMQRKPTNRVALPYGLTATTNQPSQNENH